MLICKGDYMNLHPQIIERAGKSEFIVLPIEEYQSLVEIMENYEDLNELRSAKAGSKGEKSIPLKQVLSELNL